jgi:hypothetical protein
LLQNTDKQADIIQTSSLKRENYNEASADTIIKITGSEGNAGSG